LPISSIFYSIHQNLDHVVLFKVENLNCSKIKIKIINNDFFSTTRLQLVKYLREVFKIARAHFEKPLLVSVVGHLLDFLYRF